MSKIWLFIKILWNKLLIMVVWYHVSCYVSLFCICMILLPNIQSVSGDICHTLGYHRGTPMMTFFLKNKIFSLKNKKICIQIFEVLCLSQDGKLIFKQLDVCFHLIPDGVPGKIIFLITHTSPILQNHVTKPFMLHYCCS